ncbi:hypothetical protein A0H81_00510 [Grifola frondosa]|uniref:Transcriptional regulatory protein RXT2 N-terminal domain-containing protein n=1 Tax=Grifola frondosa TaxID=5627 RepID=A0A1C7MV98_GRIFR|nr:hypothetical protein A0H81_00510 [Grifola frondosa]
MAADIPAHDMPMSRPSTSHQHHTLTSNGLKRGPPPVDDGRYEDPSFLSLSSNDMDTWYYPSHGYDSDADNISSSLEKGNWGTKDVKDAKWVRRGKMTAWGPAYEDWEAEDRARKRIKLLLPSQKEVSSSVALPHLRSPSPPLIAPYPTPNTQHLSYTSFVMDKAVTHSFRSKLFDELEQATNTLIQGEAAMRRALGRLWQVMSEDPDEIGIGTSLVPKREDVEDIEVDNENEGPSRVPNLIPVVHKLFLPSSPGEPAMGYDQSQFSHADLQLENLEKSLATLRELQDDGREYVERLEEIREGLGDARIQRNGVWDLVRKKAIAELQDAASASPILAA